MSASPEVSKALAEFVVRTRWEDIPPAVRHEAKRSLVNFFACALAGCRDPTLLAAGKVFARFSSSQDCTIIGRPERTDMLHAAALNAMSANVFDYDDTHLPTIIHPTAPVAPALFALAETRPMSGQDLLLAFILGVEVECRLGNAISPWHYQRGWHITSTCGVFGAAAAVAKVLGLDATHTLWALGNASAQAGGLVETLGTASKSMGVGNAAYNGLLSAMLAAEGFQGPPQPLEGARGFLRVMGDKPDFDSIVGGLGETWEIQKNTYKPYPCGVVLNPVIEACLELHKTPGLDVNAIERIEITGHPLLRARTDRPPPKSGREAQVSARHAVAVSLVRGKAGLDEFSDACVAEAALKAVGDRLTFVEDNSFSVDAATVRIQIGSGRAFSHFIAAARGGLQRPLSDTDLALKLETLAEWGGSECMSRDLASAVWRLDSTGNAGSLISLSGGTP
jgi:2-methylcitrate dehydratase PrpD